jgi:hypothetical protein
MAFSYKTKLRRAQLFSLYKLPIKVQRAQFNGAS